MSKRSGESVGEGEDAKKQRIGDDEQSAVSASQFEEATKYRTFKLVVEGRPLFVNPHFLGEISPFFDTLFFGNFKEGKEEEAELKEVKYAHFVGMLEVLGADHGKLPRDVGQLGVWNCVAMMKLAHRFAIDTLMLKCANYIETTFHNTSTAIHFTLSLLLACEELQVDKSLLQIVASRLASFEPDALLKQGINHMIKDPSLCAAIFVASNSRFESANPEAHQFIRTLVPSKPSSQDWCRTAGCTSKGRMCNMCGTIVCFVHAPMNCVSRKYRRESNSPFVNQEQKSAVSVEINKYFFTK